jgi:hypothetical protein
MKHAYLFCKRLGKNLPFLMFINGFILASILYFFIQSRYENGLFSVIKTDIETHLGPDDTHDSVVVKAMHVCHDLMSNRQSTFAHPTTDLTLGPAAGLFHSTSVDLMTAKGACGSFSEVLARIITTFHYPVRIAQMKAGGVFAAHNVVEAYTGTHWVLLDPIFNVYFVDRNHHLASFNDVRQDWSYYSRQVPVGYDMKYRYEDVRYTNFSKVPLVGPAIEKLLVLIAGKEYAGGISLRVIFIDTWQIYLQLAILLESLLLLAVIRIYIRSRFFPSPNTPITIKNLTKYVKLSTGAPS